MNGFVIALIVLLVVGFVLFILSVWFPTLRTVLRWIGAILLEIPYFLLYWWWYATICKAKGKAIPPVWPWKVGSARDGKKSSSAKSSPKKAR